MAKIILEKEKCIGCGSCQALCAKYFKIAEDGKSHIEGATINPETGNDELEIEKVECANSAAEACPVQCIHIEN
jgi:ferredoxin